MNQDRRWKIWLFIDTDLEKLLPIFSSFFEAVNLIYDYENVWEWITGHSAKFNTNINISRRHDDPNSLYNEPLVILTDFSQPELDSLKETERIALGIAAVFPVLVYYGWVSILDDDSYFLEAVGQFQRPAINGKPGALTDKNKSSESIQIHEQSRASQAWKKLCEYIDYVSENDLDEFIPLAALGSDLFSRIQTLPASIGKLKQVTKVQLYGSNLKSIPPEIAGMKSLQYFDPYTSYDLHWFPYEITRCAGLSDSRISTRALYGNYKNRMPFPDLHSHIIKYDGEELKCSVCEKIITYQETDQYWISLWVGTDVLPLLVNTCSKQCVDALPSPPELYLPWPHKGGKDLHQPLGEEKIFMLEMEAMEDNTVPPTSKTETPEKDKEHKNADPRPNQLIRLVRKIWDKK